jgi:protein-S-isoprenylcysteine O-methyltransferase Ste14
MMARLTLARLVSWNTVTSLWIVFCVYWAVSALSVKPTRHMEAARGRLRTAAGLGVAAFLIFSPAYHLGILNRRFVPASQRIGAAAIVLVAAGIAIAIWARRHIGEFWSAPITLKVDHQLVQSGPYSRVRHPIYSGILLAMMGTSLFVGEWRAVVGLALVFLTHGVKARREEALLASQFGQLYEEYRKRTGSLIPRLY